MQFPSVELRRFETRAWEVTPSGRWQWIQDLCWWFLKKTKAAHPHYDNDQVITQKVFSRELASAKLVSMAQDQVAIMHGVRPTRMFIGAEDFAALMKDVDLVRFGSFCFNTPRELFGMQVEVVAHMKGFLVV